MSNFVSISKSSGASGTTSATVTVTANDDYTTKSASVTVQSKTNPAVKQSIQVSQASAGVVDLSSSGLTAPSSGVMNVGTLADKGDSKYKKGDFLSKKLRFYPSLHDTAYTGSEDDLIQIYEGSSAMPSFEINWTEMNKLSGGSGYAGLYDKLNSGSNIVVPNGNKAIRESRYKQPITGYAALSKDSTSAEVITFKGVQPEEVGTTASEQTYFIVVMRGATGYDIPVSDMRELCFAFVPNDEASVDFADVANEGQGSVVLTNGNKSVFQFTAMSQSTDVELSYTVYVWSKVGHTENKSKTLGGKTFRWNDSGFSFTVTQEACLTTEPGSLSLVNAYTEYPGEMTPAEAFEKHGKNTSLYAYLSEYKYNTGEFGSFLGQIYLPTGEDFMVIHADKSGIDDALRVLEEGGDLESCESPMYINVTNVDTAAGEMAQCEFGFEISTIEDADTFCGGLINMLNTLKEGTGYDLIDTTFYYTDTTLIRSSVGGMVMNGDAETFNAYVYAEITDSDNTKYYQKLGECMLDQEDELDIVTVSDFVPYQDKSGLEVTAIIVGIDSFGEAKFSLSNSSCVVKNTAIPTNSYKIANSGIEIISNFQNASLGITAGYRFPILTTNGSTTTMTLQQGRYAANNIDISSFSLSISNLA